MNLIISFLLFSGFALFGEKVESKCVLDCRAKGYQYHYCDAKCSDGHSKEEKVRDQSHSPPSKETDSKCIKDCTKEGYQYGQCEVKCSY